MFFPQWKKKQTPQDRRRFTERKKQIRHCSVKAKKKIVLLNKLSDTTGDTRTRWKRDIQICGLS